MICFNVGIIKTLSIACFLPSIGMISMVIPVESFSDQCIPSVEWMVGRGTKPALPPDNSLLSI